MRTIASLLTFAAGLYLAVGLILYFMQGSMVYLAGLPGRALEASPSDIGLPFEDVMIGTRDGERLHGWYVPADNARGVLLFFHGNAGNISHRLESIAIFNHLGLDVLIIDYRGYGRSSGSPSEQGTYRDAEAAWRHLVEDRGVPPSDIVIFGRSLGGAVGAWLAARIQAAAVIIESSFSSGADMARRLYPVFPAKLLTRLKYPVRDYAARLRCPALVIHSRDDEIIPFGMGQTIYEAIEQEKSFLELRGDHNGGFWISREDYLSGLDRFLSGLLGHRQGA
jgi:fermentation-respiration switch protein FrsA (DUF1100 family)